MAQNNLVRTWRGGYRRNCREIIRRLQQASDLDERLPSLASRYIFTPTGSPCLIADAFTCFDLWTSEVLRQRSMLEHVLTVPTSLAPMVAAVVAASSVVGSAPGSAGVEGLTNPHTDLPH